jgi:hypothetical protein
MTILCAFSVRSAVAVCAEDTLHPWPDLAVVDLAHDRRAQPHPAGIDFGGLQRDGGRNQLDIEEPPLGQVWQQDTEAMTMAPPALCTMDDHQVEGTKLRSTKAGQIQFRPALTPFTPS